MRNAYRLLGLFIGCGAVESGRRPVVRQRLSLSGMRWSQPVATPILTLRCQQACGRWEEIWAQIHSQPDRADLHICGF